jgi:putative two-component system response regulator
MTAKDVKAMAMNVLIVDDDPLALAMLTKTLRQAGHAVERAGDGVEALDVLRATRTRLVLCDWDMPRMNGLQFCRAVREMDLPGYVYVILLTAHDKPEEKVRGLTAGADDFVTKPYHPDELLARVSTGERVLSLETRDVAIFAMAKLAESRDTDTGAHLERVRAYSRILAQHLAAVDKFRHQISAEYIRLIYQTSPLHDIGKVGIPDSVLLKPGRLEPAEFEVMKTHASIGARTLDAALQTFPGVTFLQMAREIAATHHEKFDGTGYPAGLRGQDIPLSGRIVAVADVYDALTSERPYKRAFSHDEARNIILKDSGTHFDPDVVEAFHKCEEKFLGVRQKLSGDTSPPSP